MTSWARAVGRGVLFWAALAAPATLGALGTRPAQAQEPRPTAGVSGAACAVRGTPPGPKGTPIFDAPTGGRAVATFTGAFQPMTISDFPADPTTARARIATRAGVPSLRVDGWTNASLVPFYSARDLSVVPGHVWIADAQRVRVVQAASGALTAEIVVPGTGGQTVRAAAPCDAFSLQPGTATVMPVPGDGRGYLSKGTAIELFDAPGGAALFTLRVAEGAAQLFWSTEARAGFVHVRTRGALVVDAWAPQRELEPLKKGEMMDQFSPPASTVAAATLQLTGEPRLVVASKDIPFRARRDDKDKVIGVIEAGAEIYVLETMVGWVNVLPRGLGVAPADEGGFWVLPADAPARP